MFLIKLFHSSYYYHPLEITEEELEIMNLIDKIYTGHPFFGLIKITDALRKQGNFYNHKRIYRLMRIMGIEALTPKKKLSKPGKDHLVYPYLLRNVRTTETNQVWSSDITYLPIYKGYAYLVAVIDWFSRYILSCNYQIVLMSIFVWKLYTRHYKKANPKYLILIKAVSLPVKNLLKQLLEINYDEYGF